MAELAKIHPRKSQYTLSKPYVIYDTLVCLVLYQQLKHTYPLTFGNPNLLQVFVFWPRHVPTCAFSYYHEFMKLTYTFLKAYANML